ncbi:DUF4062 domain-containing protein [Henriciella litoralis]|uniref:DUF4062 domain-containing protein n=1 Tax=Henriciella litoralis TaxID=568102 RepID=UPI00146AFA00|nr:DUF4062 domain-containing protein [Henriciella litoralis]
MRFHDFDYRDLPRKKFSVFVSSTIPDLVDERRSAYEIISRTQNIPIGMEIFHATHLKNGEYLREKVREADIFVLILGRRSGGTASSGESYTELEYEEAKKSEKPILAFLIDGDSFKYSEPTERLENFREKVIEDDWSHVQYDPDKKDDFNIKFQHSLYSETSRLIREAYPGWVRSEPYDLARSLKTLPHQISNSPIFDDLIQALSKLELLAERTNRDVDEKFAISEFFWDKYETELLLNSDWKVFFEAGSTIDFILKKLVNILDKKSQFQRPVGRLQIFINSVISKLILDLREKTIPSIKSYSYFPDPPIRERYGKTIGPLSNVGDVPAVQYRKTGIQDASKKSQQRLLTELRKKLNSDKSMCLISFTGMFENHGYAPFVRSYKNVLFKRSLFEHPSAKVVFADGAKWSNPTRNLDGIYMIFSEAEWRNLLADHPICFIVTTYRTPRRADLIEFFVDGKKFQLFEEVKGNLHLLHFSNQKFREKVGVDFKGYNLD